MSRQSQRPKGFGIKLQALLFLVRVRFGVWGLSLLLFSLLPIPAHATTGTLTINADTTLTEDHYGSIIIGTDDITLDCGGHSVTGPGSGNGILLIRRTGVTVKN